MRNISRTLVYISVLSRTLVYIYQSYVNIVDTTQSVLDLFQVYPHVDGRNLDSAVAPLTIRSMSKGLYIGLMKIYAFPIFFLERGPLSFEPINKSQAKVNNILVLAATK